VLTLTLVVVAVGPPMCARLVLAARRAGAADRVRALGRHSRWRVPGRVRSRLAAALRDADVAWTPEESVEHWALAAAVAALVGVAVSPVLAVVAGVAVLIGGPVALVFARSRHERHFAGALPGALEQVAAELRGGGTVVGALERLTDHGGPVAGDLRRVTVRTRLGLPLVEALAGWPLEHDAPGVRAAAGALAVAVTMGGRAAEAIDGLASSLRHRLDAVAEARSLSAQARLSAVVVGAAPIGYLAFASMIDPGAVQALVGTGVGRACLVVGLALEGVAGGWIRHILRSAG
jgi:tight adherence protein B